MGRAIRRERRIRATMGLLAGVLRATNPFCAQVAVARLAELTPSAAIDVIQTANNHGVDAWLSRRLPNDDGAWRALAQKRAAFTAAHVRDVAAIRGISAALAAINCPWALLKGRALAEQFYPRPDMRFGVDIDVLVPPSRFGSAIEALQDAGWSLLDRNWPLALEAMPAELRLMSPNGALLDLHWHLLAERARRLQFELPTDSLLQRRRLLPSGRPALDPVDQLVHLGVHGALSGANRLLWLLDVNLAAARIVDWDELAASARVARAGAALSLLLLRAQRWLGTSVPTEFWRAVGAGPDWRSTCVAIDRVSPLRADPMRAALARSWARSVRSNTLATAAELSRHAATFLRSGAHLERQADPLKDPADSRSPLFVADDARARIDYLAMVAHSS